MWGDRGYNDRLEYTSHTSLPALLTSSRRHAQSTGPRWAECVCGGVYVHVCVSVRMGCAVEGKRKAVWGRLWVRGCKVCAPAGARHQGT